MRDTQKVRFTVDIIIEPDDHGFHAYAPALRGLHMGGDTEEEAISNAVDATLAYIESLVKHGDPIPLSMVHETRETIRAHHQDVFRREFDLPLDQLQPA